MRQGQMLATGIGVACVLAIVLVAFDSVWPDWTGLKGRTLWDIAELVLVPLSLAGIAYLLSAAQRREDRAIARTREQYDTVQSYLSVITDLLRSGPLEDERLRSIARSRTLTVLGTLDANGKRTVMRFLQEAKLIAAPSPTIDLNARTCARRPVEHRSGRAELERLRPHRRGPERRVPRLGAAALHEPPGADLSRANLVHAEVGAALLDEKTTFDKALLISASLSEAYPYARSELARVGKANQERAEADWLAAIQGASWTRSGVRLTRRSGRRASTRRRPARTTRSD